REEIRAGEGSTTVHSQDLRILGQGTWKSTSGTIPALSRESGRVLLIASFLNGVVVARHS
ncbi:MAG: hypothetical protein ACXU95_05900, partial [Isosphaeraceae bacterium]